MTRVTFAADYETPGGRNYKGGTTADVNAPEARNLIYRGIARAADETSTNQAESSANPAETTSPEGTEEGAES